MGGYHALAPTQVYQDAKREGAAIRQSGNRVSRWETGTICLTRTMGSVWRAGGTQDHGFGGWLATLQRREPAGFVEKTGKFRQRPLNFLRKPRYIQDYRQSPESRTTPEGNPCVTLPAPICSCLKFAKSWISARPPIISASRPTPCTSTPRKALCRHSSWATGGVSSGPVSMSGWTASRTSRQRRS